MMRILEGIRVLDFSSLIAGPYCAMLLAAMGAEVIRVEPPGGGLDRDVGPYAPNGEGLYPWHYCCNKKGITLNLQTGRGRLLLRELLAKTDIVVEAFTPSVKKELGMDFDSLQAIDKGIILVSISGYGQYGPYADRRGLDTIAQGMAGLMAITGMPEGPPLRSGAAVVDYGAALNGALGAVLALYQRQKSGRGQAVDVSLLDTAVSFMETVFSEYVMLGVERKPMGNRRPYTAPTDLFRAKDGYVYISVSTNSFWKRMCDVAGWDEYRDDPRFNSNRVRYKSQEFLNHLAATWVKDRTVEEVVTALNRAGIPSGPVYSIPEIIKDKHIRQREMLVELEHPGGGTFLVPGLVPKLSETPGRIDQRAPVCGEHNREVYGDLLGRNSEEIAALAAGGVI
jgi:crotonobetainyl-CoA:carnitine CoA-transferase CaiB-like acyl-CoA transferase